MADEWGQGQTAAADFEFDGSGYSKDDLGGGGEIVDKEGWYHWEVTDVKPELDTLSNQGKEKSPSICFHLLVLQSVQGQSPAGSRHFHRIYLAAKGGAPPAEGAVKSALRFGLGLGLLAAIEKDGKEVIVDKATGLTRIPSTVWNRAKGMQFISKIKLNESDKDDSGKKKYADKFEIPFGRAYQVDDSAVADVAKNPEALAMLGKGGSSGPGAAKSPAATNGQNKSPANQSAPVGAGVGAADDDLSDL